jgi:DNA-binding response OmpR family regulator
MLRPRLMLLDVNMPGWDGVRVADAARNLDHRAIIILMTGDVDALLHALSSDCGAVMAFPKPVELQKLMGFIRSTFGTAEIAL